MIQLIKLQCPNCSANLEVDSSLKQCFCQYCGTKLLINNENEKTIHIVDEAEIIRARNEYDLLKSHMDRSIGISQLELEKQQLELEQRREQNLVKKAVFCAIWTAVFVLGIIMAYSSHGIGRRRGITTATIQVALMWGSYVLINPDKNASWKVAIGYLLRIIAFGLIIVYICVTPG